MNKKIILTFVCFAFACTTIKAETYISNIDGTIIVFKESINCKNIKKIPKTYTCKGIIEFPDGNGIIGWRKWIKQEYAKNTSYLNIKRGKIKVINNQKTLYYKKWPFGKKIIVGLLKS
ncbi:hypothetical protein [Urechidicola croceus]|uniref:Lipoprotein n=1 Tax=Urechidicola croceus TaxID=1850246 RepID=A0A1D8P877_9FLAO|nr:hypothetical protein [Urechidicola croceus]AOW20778.1 hypothetical protein LPB138_08850 [Urechidicola croceus]